MNERIKELAGMAKVIAEETINKKISKNDELDAFAEKFAELIVLECEKVAKDPKWYGESPSNGWRNPIRHVCNVMKEHFGIEE